jgi:hypothetical protein
MGRILTALLVFSPCITAPEWGNIIGKQAKQMNLVLRAYYSQIPISQEYFWTVDQGAPFQAALPAQSGLGLHLLEPNAGCRTQNDLIPFGKPLFGFPGSNPRLT